MAMNYKITDLSIGNNNYIGISRELLINDVYRELPFLAIILYCVLSKNQFKSGNDELTVNMEKIEKETGINAEEITLYLELLEDVDLIITASNKVAVQKQREIAKNGIYKIPSFIQKDVFDNLDWYAKVLYAMYRNRYLFTIKENMGDANFYTEDNILYGLYRIEDIAYELMIDESTVEKYNEQLIHEHLLNILLTTNGYQRFYTFEATNVPRQSNTKIIHYEKQKLITGMPPQIAFTFQTMTIESIEQIQHAMRSYIAHHNINNPNRYLRKHDKVISKIIQTMAIYGEKENEIVYTKPNLCFYIFNNEMKRYKDNPSHFTTNNKYIKHHIDIFHSMMSTILSQYEIDESETAKIKKLKESLPEFHKSTINLLRLFSYEDAIILGQELRATIELTNQFSNDDISNNFIDYSDNISSINIAILEIKGLLIISGLEFSHIAPLLSHIFIDIFNKDYDWETTNIGIDVEKLYKDLNKVNNEYSDGQEVHFMMQLLTLLKNCNDKDGNKAVIQQVLNTFAGFHRSIFPIQLEEHILSLPLSDVIHVFKMLSLGMADYTNIMKSKLSIFHIDIPLVESRLLRCVDIILHIKHNKDIEDSTYLCRYIVNNEIEESYNEDHQYEYVSESETNITKLINKYLNECMIDTL